VAWVLAGAMIEKFGGDSIREMRANFESYLERMNEETGENSETREKETHERTERTE